MGTDRDGLDSILAGNEEGAKGCCLSVDMTSDGIAVLSSDGYVLAPNGGAVAVCDHTYTEPVSYTHLTLPTNPRV